MSLRGAILVLSRPRLVQMRVFDLFLLDDVAHLLILYKFTRYT